MTKRPARAGHPPQHTRNDLIFPPRVAGEGSHIWRFIFCFTPSALDIPKVLGVSGQEFNREADEKPPRLPQITGLVPSHFWGCIIYLFSRGIGGIIPVYL